MNARDEFLKHTSDKPPILCATIKYDDYTTERAISLNTNYTKEQYNDFLARLDFEYNSGYGSQCLYGTIWYTNATWSTRGEYDGSEWWEYNSLPEIPEEFK